MRKRGTRVAQRRARRAARREARMAAEARLSALGWDGKGLEGRTTEEIVGALAALGVEVAEEGFRELAIAKGNVEAVAEDWEPGKDWPREWEDIPYFAARALWPRWAPGIFAPEVFLHQHLPGFLLFDELPAAAESGQSHWRAAKAVVDLVAPTGGEPRMDLWEDLNVHTGGDLDWWLMGLPVTLASPEVGMADQAMDLCRRMASVCGADHLLGELSALLIEAGRRDEALRQVEENLSEFPETARVRIKGGEVFKKAGDVARAEALFREAYEFSDPSVANADRYGAVQCLLDLYREAGRTGEFEALASAEKDLLEAWETAEDDEEGEDEHEPAPEDELWNDDESGEEEEDGVMPLGTDPVPVPSTADFPPGTIRRSAPKVGRNDPCPCGRDVAALADLFIAEQGEGERSGDLAGKAAGTMWMHCSSRRTGADGEGSAVETPGMACAARADRLHCLPMELPKTAAAHSALKLLPAYTGVDSLEAALQDPRAVRLLWLEILVNDRLDLGPWRDHPEVRGAYAKACRWFSTYGHLVQALISREPLPHDPTPVDPREYRTFAEAMRFISDHR